ncbi:MAG: hypothetical protein SOZ34_07445 [Clostridia bacterium]|nr:hypothetical protein [Clostridia bacterium]
MKKGRKRVITLYVVLRVLVVAVMAFAFVQKDYDHVFLCILTLLLFMIPSIIDKKLNIKLPTVLECIIILFVFAAEILGEIQEFYLRFPYWDTILHTLNGFIMAAIGFAMIDILNQNPKLYFNMSPVFAAFVAFCFSMTIGVLWEFFEFGMDTLTFTDMQKDSYVTTVATVDLNPDKVNVPIVIKDISKTVIGGKVNGTEQSIVIDGGYLDLGLRDTMFDLIVNCIGAICFSFLGVLYIMGRSHFAKSFIPQMKTPSEIEETRKEIEEMKNKYRKKNRKGKKNE